MFYHGANTSVLMLFLFIFALSQGIWSKEGTRLFQKLCSDRTLVAAVHSYQRDFLLLYLCDTHTEEDLYVHSTLQAEGHAVACAADTHVRNLSHMFLLYYP